MFRLPLDSTLLSGQLMGQFVLFLFPDTAFLSGFLFVAVSYCPRPLCLLSFLIHFYKLPAISCYFSFYLSFHLLATQSTSMLVPILPTLSANLSFIPRLPLYWAHWGPTVLATIPTLPFLLADASVSLILLLFSYIILNKEFWMPYADCGPVCME